MEWVRNNKPEKLRDSDVQGVDRGMRMRSEETRELRKRIGPLTIEEQQRLKSADVS